MKKYVISAIFSISLVASFVAGFQLKRLNISNLVNVRRSNPAAPLHIPTYDGSNYGLHPKCLYFRDCWRGHKYWFVFTPYADMNDAMENPCIYTSEDGLDFAPVRTAYPLDNIDMDCTCEYNSDPHLVYNNDLDRIECWWRKVYTDKCSNRELRNSEIIYRSYSADGKNWSKREIIYIFKNPINETRGFISPAILYEAGRYMIWCCNIPDADGENRNLDYYEYINGDTVIHKQRTEFRDIALSHLDVIKKDSVYYLIAQDIHVDGYPYYLYTFTDPLKADYDCRGNVLVAGCNNSWDGSRLYRPSLTVVDDKWRLYYSAYNGDNGRNCNCGVIEFSEWTDIAPVIEVEKKMSLYRDLYHSIKSTVKSLGKKLTHH